MADFPPLTHVALTVRDLSVSVPWYGALFGVEPAIGSAEIEVGILREEVQWSAAQPQFHAPAPLAPVLSWTPPA